MFATSIYYFRLIKKGRGGREQKTKDEEEEINQILFSYYLFFNMVPKPIQNPSF